MGWAEVQGKKPKQAAARPAILSSWAAEDPMDPRAHEGPRAYMARLIREGYISKDDFDHRCREALPHFSDEAQLRALRSFAKQEDKHVLNNPSAFMMCLLRNAEQAGASPLDLLAKKAAKLLKAEDHGLDDACISHLAKLSAYNQVQVVTKYLATLPSTTLNNPNSFFMAMMREAIAPAAGEDVPRTGEIGRQARAELDRLYQTAKIVKRDMPETNMSLLARLSASQQIAMVRKIGAMECPPGAKKEAMICSLLKAAVAEGQSRAAKPAGGRPSVIEVTKMHQIPVRYKAGAEGAAPGAKDLSVVINRDSKLYDDTMTKCYKVLTRDQKAEVRENGAETAWHGVGAAYMKSLSEGRLKLADCLHLPHRRSNPAYNPDWEASWKNKNHIQRDFILSELDADSSRSRLEELMDPEYEMPWQLGEEEPAGLQEEYEPTDAEFPALGSIPEEEEQPGERPDDLPLAEFPPLGSIAEEEEQPGERPDDPFEANGESANLSPEAQLGSLAVKACSTVAMAASQVAGTAAEAGEAVPRTAAKPAVGPLRGTSSVHRPSDSSDASSPVPVHAPVADRDRAQRQPEGASAKQAAPATGNEQAPASPTSPGPGLTYQQVADRVRLSDARRLRQLGQPLTENGTLCPEAEAVLEELYLYHGLGPGDLNEPCMKYIRNSPADVQVETLTSLRTFKSAGIHCPSAYIITSLAMVFLELRERQAQRERVADKGDHLAAGLQRKEASLAESEFPCLGASTISAYKPASKDTTAGEIFEPPISPLLPGWSSSCAWEPPASTDSLRSLAGQPEAAQKVAAAKGDTPPARVNAKPEHVSFNQWVAATRRHCA